MEPRSTGLVQAVDRSRDTQLSLVNTIPSAQELMVYQTWAKNAFDSQMYRGVGKESAIMMIMLAAREYGIGPAQALNGGLHIIEGKVELSARMMSALIRRAKHKLEIVESTDTRCTIKGRRSDTHETHTVTFTIEEAQQAGLVKDKGGWKKTPTDMLYARCISRLARQLFSDVIGIGYIEGEISDPSASNEVVEVLEEPSKSHAEVFEDIWVIFTNYSPDFKREELQQFIEAVADHHKKTTLEVMNSFALDFEISIQNFIKWRNRNEKVIPITDSSSTN